MKKTLSIIAALVLALGMTQCKKAEKPQASTGDPIHVTFTATYGGERTSFNPAGGSFTWNTSGTEYIYVGCEGIDGCIGELTATATGGTSLTFEGTLTSTPASGATLHFFYLGNGRHQNASTLDFSSQNGGNLTNYHIAVGSQKYDGSNNFSAYLEPLVAFAYFDLSGFAGETVYMHGDGVYATATIDYQTGTIEKGTKGYINIGTASASKYVALIPSTESATTLNFDSNGHEGCMVFERGIRKGKFYAINNAEALAVSASVVSIAEDGTVPGLFSVAGTNGITTKMVRFSRGNLQYKSGSWRFAENQWSYTGAWNTSDWVDLFGWGTWGEGKNPLLTSKNNGDYEWNTDFRGTIGGHNTWRTLTKDEWYYLFNTRTNAANKVGYATVNEKTGIIILPDSFTDPGTNSNGGSFVPKATSGYGQNVYVGTNWDDMETAGAVFLPAAGRRLETGVGSVGTHGYYWSATPSANAQAYFLYFHGTYMSQITSTDRYIGSSVRLVR